MSKGPWKKETRTRQAGFIESLRDVAKMEREATDAAVMHALKVRGPLTVAQLAAETGVAESTIQNSLDRLRRDGDVKKLDKRVRAGKFGNMAHPYALGVEEISEVKRKADADVAAALARARSADLSVCGIFRIAAIQARWTAEERIAEEQRQRAFKANRKAADQREAA